MSQSTDVNQTTELISQLVNVCRESQCVFEIAAGGVEGRLLRAELLQYSGQRREFIAELNATIRKFSDRIVDPGTLNGPLQRNSATLRDAVEHRDNAEILAECERSEDAARSAYRRVLAEELSPTIHAMINSHLAAIGRVHDRIERLSVNTRSSHN